MRVEDYVTRAEYQSGMNEVRGDISHLYSKVNDVDRRTTTIEALLTNLKDLPDTIARLDKTLVLMGQNLTSLNKKMDEHIQSAEVKDKQQDALIKQMDENSKIDIVKVARDNWWKICIAGAAVFYVVEPYIKSLMTQSVV